jgi:hypothetical protein
MLSLCHFSTDQSNVDTLALSIEGDLTRHLRLSSFFQPRDCFASLVSGVLAVMLVVVGGGGGGGR